MNIYPAIDIYGGRVVRLERGDFAKETVYSESPAEIARKWESQGAEWLHVVDLEGAKTGKISNLESLSKIRESVQCKIQCGGGIRSFDDIQTLVDKGIDRVVIGTRAFDRDFLENALGKLGDHIAVGLDCRDGFVQLEGWTKDGSVSLDDALSILKQMPVKMLIYTDISRDGMLQGSNFDGLTKVLEGSAAGVILSGGVASLEDIEKAAKVSQANFEGVIIGKALYEERFELKDAIQLSH